MTVLKVCFLSGPVALLDILERRATYLYVMQIWEPRMDEILKALVPSLNILLGAFAAWLGARYQAWVNDRIQKARLKTEKLERAYMLCQSIYDGHRREINKAKSHLPSDPGKFMEARQHPGMEMSELKMLIRSYTPELADSLQLIDTGHEPLKKAFRKLEQQVLEKHAFDQQELSRSFGLWEQHLNDLGTGSNAIKRGLEQELLKLTK